MKIAHYINDLSSGGAEKLLTDILPLMKKRGYNVCLIISNNINNNKKYQEILNQDHIKIINLKKSIYNPIQIFVLIKIIKKEKIDIIHAHLFPSQYWLAIASLLLNKKVKLVKTEHSVHNIRRNYKIFSYLERWVYNRYSKIVAITDSVNLSLINWLNKSDKTIVINNGVNLKQIESIKENTDPISYEFINASFYNILMVGRFDSKKQKDQNSLLLAMCLLSNEYRLYFVGDGPNLENVKKLCSEMKLQDRVNFLGVRTDVYKLMSKVNLNILSSNHEGLSGVALEAMASGRAFIGSDVIGINDVVPNQNFLFKPGNPQNLASKIKELKETRSLEEVLIKQGLTHVKKYDISIMVDCYLALYNSI